MTVSKCALCGRERKSSRDYSFTHRIVNGARAFVCSNVEVCLRRRGKTRVPVAFVNPTTHEVTQSYIEVSS